MNLDTNKAYGDSGTMTSSEEAFLMDNYNESWSAWNATTTPPRSCDDDSCYVNFAHFVNMMDLVAVPIIVGVGVVGNVLSCLVFTCTYLRRVSSSVYLAALAVVDTVYLCVLLFSWLVNVGIQVYTHTHTSSSRNRNSDSKRWQEPKGSMNQSVSNFFRVAFVIKTAKRSTKLKATERSPE